MTEIRIIKIGGSPYEMGFRFGASSRELVQGFMDAYYKILLYCSAGKAREPLT